MKWYDCLQSGSDGYSIYASTILKYVDEECYSSDKRLHEVLKVLQSGSEVFEELDKLYRQILSTCPRTDLLLLILETLFFSDPIVQSDMTAEMVEVVLNLSHREVASTLHDLHLVLNISEYSGGTYIEPFHVSLPDSFAVLQISLDIRW